MARLLFGLYYWVGKPLTRDEQEYLALAVNLAQGHGFAYPASGQPSGGAHRVDRAPFYPLFLVPLVSGETRAGIEIRETPTAVKVAQSALGTVVVWLIALLTRRTAGPIAGVCAAWMAALYPPLVWMPAYVLSETLFAALALGCAAVLGSMIDRSPETFASRHVTSARLFSAGVIGGLGALTRPTLLLFLFGAGVWLLISRGLRAAIIVALGALLVILPWTIRNARAHGRFVLISAQSGVTFWTGNHPLSSGEGDLAANPPVARANQEFLRQHGTESPAELEQRYQDEAWHYIAQDPLWWGGLLLRKLFFLWVPIGPSYTLHSARYYWASVIPYALVLPLAIAGYRQLWRRGRRPWSLWLLALSALAASVFYIVQERFRIPIVDPALIVGASAWIATRFQPTQLTTDDI